MGGDKLLAAVAGIEPESALARSVAERRHVLFKAHYLPDLGPTHGARVLVDRLRSRGLICAAVSSSPANDIADLLRAAGVADLMEVVVSADDAERSKPDADLIEVALDRVGVTAPEALIIGDTPYDIEAGEGAGVRVVALRCGGLWTDKQLGAAVAIYDDPADLSSQLDKSVLALDRDSDPAPGLGRTRSRRAALG
jgi:HAD superfamily hydrolase (TIGR01509 family)